MPISYGHDIDASHSLDIDKIKDAINEAEFNHEVHTAKGAPVPKVSRFADQPEVDPKYQRVKATLTIDVGSLPHNESKFLLDTFDRFATQQNGKLVLTENCNKTDFDPKQVYERIQNYANQKVDRALSKVSQESEYKLPTQHVIQQNENSGLIGWLKRSLSSSNELSR